MEEKKEKAVEKAREYFHRYGYRGSSLSALIAEIGISKPTFYNYFKNKEELFHTVMLETYNEFHYQYNQRARGASNAMEKLDLFIMTWEWFLEEYPIFQDLFRPGNDLLMRWADSRYAKDFYAEGVETIRSILEQGREEGIFAADIDAAECAHSLYYVVMLALSTDPNIFRKSGQPELRVSARSLVAILGRGILSRDTL
jgi:TetR/AcrR family transcriptional regulator, cholesterol catabolism regulator